MDTSFSGHVGGDAVAVHRNSRLKRNQTLENHVSCAKLLNDAESKTRILYNKIMTMSAKHYDSHTKINKILKEFVLLRNALLTEIHSQIKIPNGADESYLDNVYTASPPAWQASSSPAERWE